jgi:hypothetical protein
MPKGSGTGDRNSALPRSASAGVDVSAATPWLRRWLALGRHGEMDYMAKHAALRATPQRLLPGTLSVISARLPYWPDAVDARQVLADGRLAYVSRYALGRDYHKTVRSRLQKLAERLRDAALETLGEPFACRVFSDSAPVLETEFAPSGDRLARQAYAVADARRFVALSRRDLHHPAAAAMTRRSRSLRRLPALPRRLPHRRRSSPPTKSTPGAAFPT